MHNQNYLCLHYFLCFCCLSAESQITPYNTSSDGLRMQNTKRFKRTDRTRELLDMFIKPREHTNLNKTKKEMLNEGKDRIRHFDVEEMKKSLAKNEIFETVNANILRQQKGVKAVCGGSKNVFQFDDLIAYQSVRFKQLRTSKHNIKEFKSCFSFGGEITVNKLGVYIPTPYIMVSAYLHFDIHNYPDFWVLMESYLGVQTFRENWAINDYKCKNNGSFEEEIDYDKGKCWFNFSCQSEGMKSKLHIVTFGVAGNFSLKKGSASDAPLPTYEYITDSTFVYEQHNYTPPTLDKQYWNLTPKWTTTVTTTTQSEAEKEDEEQKKKVNKAATVVGVIVAVVAIVLVLRVAFIFAALWWWFQFRQEGYFNKEAIKTWLEDPGVEEYEGLNITALKMDQAYAVGVADQNVGVYSVSDDCFRCPFELQKTLSAHKEESWVVSTARRSTWRVYAGVDDDYVSSRNTTGLLCQLRPELGQFGVYRLNITGESCEVTTTRDPVDIYSPLLLLLGVLGATWVLYGVGRLIMSRVRRTGKLRYGDKELAIQQRLRALDTFRGLAIVMMIFVNDGAGGYWWLEHATWNGLCAGDLVFPAFLWIMGVCVPLSVKSAFAKGVPRWKICAHILRRSVIMFLLGMSLNTIYGSNMLHRLRIFGVLQRLAVAYLVSAGFYALSAPKYYTPPRGACGQALKDVLSCVWCWVLAAGLITVHSVITFAVHDPNCPAGYLGPGGKHDDWFAPNCSGGAAGYIDRLLLGESHLFQNSDARRVYGGLPTDPEGLLGCLTSSVQALLGVQAGATVLLQRSHKSRVSRWLAWALVFALVGALLAGFSREHGSIPINKNLWSMSFVLVTSACSLVLLSICYVFTDAWRLWGGGPFRSPGLNAIALYIGHSVCSHLFPFHWKIPNMRTHSIHLAEAVWGTALWVIIAHVMAKKKVFITL